MRFKYDIRKSEQLRKNPKRGIGFDDVQELFEHYYYEDLRCDDPTQYSATGWVQGKLYTVIYEQRFDNEGLHYHLVTLWKATRGTMSKTAEKIPTADEIAEMADRGEDISKFFAGDGKMKPPLNKSGMQSVSVDFTPEMLHQLDNIVREVNISRQAVIKMYIRQAIDQYYMAKKAMAS